MAQEALGGLFGPTEEEIQQLIDERGRADINALYNNAPNPLRIVGANMAQSGRMLGGALESLGGYVDPRVDKARKMEMVKQSVLSTGVTPDTDPIGFAKLSAREFARMGLGDEAFGAALYAKNMQDEAAAVEWEKEAKRGDWQNRLDVQRMASEYGLREAQIRAAASGSGGAMPRPFEIDPKINEMYVNQVKAFLKANPNVAAAFGVSSRFPFGMGGLDEDQLDSVAGQLAIGPTNAAAAKVPVPPNWLKGAVEAAINQGKEPPQEAPPASSVSKPVDRSGNALTDVYNWYRDARANTERKNEAFYKKREEELEAKAQRDREGTTYIPPVTTPADAARPQMSSTQAVNVIEREVNNSRWRVRKDKAAVAREFIDYYNNTINIVPPGAKAYLKRLAREFGVEHSIAVGR